MHIVIKKIKYYAFNLVLVGILITNLYGGNLTNGANPEEEEDFGWHSKIKNENCVNVHII